MYKNQQSKLLQNHKNKILKLLSKIKQVLKMEMYTRMNRIKLLYNHMKSYNGGPVQIMY